MATTTIRFECGSEDRMSPDFTGFDFIQMTYLSIHGELHGKEIEIAQYDIHAKYGWFCMLDQQEYSDVIIF